MQNVARKVKKNQPTVQQSKNKKPVFVFNLKGDRARQYKRRKQLARLYRDCYRFGLVHGDDRAWSILIADIAVFVSDILDADSFEVSRARIGIPIPADIRDEVLAETGKIVAAKGARYKPITARKAGELLGITKDIRAELKLDTLLPIDQSDEERLEQRKERKRAYDRQRVRNLRADKPKRTTNFTNTEPWEEAGISRATWYRKGFHLKARETETNESYANLKEDRGVTPIRLKGRDWLLIATPGFSENRQLANSANTGEASSSSEPNTAMRASCEATQHHRPSGERLLSTAENIETYQNRTAEVAALSAKRENGEAGPIGQAEGKPADGETTPIKVAA